jgi:quinol monooxygenase YgiN
MAARPCHLIPEDPLKPELARGFDELVDRTVREIGENESGTLAYLVHDVSDAAASRVFYELYRDREAFDEHERQPHVKRFLTERGAYLVGDPVVWWLSPTGGVTKTGMDGSDG